MAIADDFTIHPDPTVRTFSAVECYDYLKGLWEEEEHQELVDLSGLGTPKELETAVEVQRKLARSNKHPIYGYPKDAVTSYEFVILDFKTNKEWTL